MNDNIETLTACATIGWCTAHEPDGHGGVFHYSTDMGTNVLRAHSDPAGEVNNTVMILPLFIGSEKTSSHKPMAPWQLAGWSSLETYAAFQWTSSDLAASAEKALSTARIVHGDITDEQAGQILDGMMQRYLEELLDAGLIDEHDCVRDDLGAPGDVDWSEVAGVFLATR